MNVTMTADSITDTSSAGASASGSTRSAGLQARLEALRKQESTIQAKISELATDATASESKEEELQLYQLQLENLEAQIQQVEQQLAEAQAQTQGSQTKDERTLENQATVAETREANATGARDAVAGEPGAAGEKRRPLPEYSTVEVEA
jgi:chromosome segregation ATPase